MGEAALTSEAKQASENDSLLEGVSTVASVEKALDNTVQGSADSSMSTLLAKVGASSEALVVSHSLALVKVGASTVASQGKVTATNVPPSASPATSDQRQNADLVKATPSVEEGVSVIINVPCFESIKF